MDGWYITIQYFHSYVQKSMQITYGDGIFAFWH